MKENKLLPLPLQAENDSAVQIDELLASSGDERVPTIREAMQRVMTEKCSVFRNRAGLTEALSLIQELKTRYARLAVAHKGQRFNYELEEALELGNMLKTAEAVAFSALDREESRGSHFRSDYSKRNDEEWLKHTLVYASTEGLKLRYKPVVVNRFPPETRRY
jgi:succinate dehydrogenase / fumarate reductase flavoprotein subunit